jgi:hypothetical protein
VAVEAADVVLMRVCVLNNNYTCGFIHIWGRKTWKVLFCRPSWKHDSDDMNCELTMKHVDLLTANHDVWYITFVLYAVHVSPLWRQEHNM